jgi:predicted MFS family arabinose efflux permease
VRHARPGSSRSAADAPPGNAGRFAFPATLLVTMTASAYQLFVLAVLAAPLIDDFGLSRAQLGLIGSMNTLVGATSAPLTGRLTDRIGARRSVVAVLVLSAICMALMAGAPNAWWLAVATLVGGLPQGWGNPATNHLISSRVAVGRRGGVTGVKQSGVTLGVFLSGATMPAMASAWGWRTAIWVFAGVFALLAVVVHVTLGPDPGGPERPMRAPPIGVERVPLDPFIRRLAVYALLMGAAGGAVGRFFPLFAEESAGYSTETAGLLVAVGGLLGMVARVFVARVAEARVSPTRLLGLLSIVGVAYFVLLSIVTDSTGYLLLLSPPLNAVGIAAWNAAAMLAIIMFVTTAHSGRASGVVMAGFFGGITIAGPLAGLAVDTWGQYRPVWLISAGLAAAAASLMLTARASGRERASRDAAAAAP